MHRYNNIHRNPYNGTYIHSSNSPLSSSRFGSAAVNRPDLARFGPLKRVSNAHAGCSVGQQATALLRAVCQLVFGDVHECNVIPREYARKPVPTCPVSIPDQLDRREQRDGASHPFECDTLQGAFESRIWSRRVKHRFKAARVATHEMDIGVL